MFLAWKGDHSPKHVHVYRDKKLIVKWDLENWLPMKGDCGKRILKLIEQLIDGGEL